MSKPTAHLDPSRHSNDKPAFQHGHRHCLDNSIALKNKDSDITLTDDKYNGTNEFSKNEAQSIDIELASLSSNSLAEAAAMGDDMLSDEPAYGWVVVFACFVYQMVSMGLCNSFGVFQV